MAVGDIMKLDPITIDPDATVQEAAARMLEGGVGSLIVIQKGSPLGILTERDLVTKVLAVRGKDSGKVKEVMSSPVVTIPIDFDVNEAAELMGSRRIRRLPILDGGQLVGIVTENDLLKVYPQLIEITREKATAGLEGEGRGLPGTCDNCGNESTDLLSRRSRMLCPDCRP